MRVAVVDIGTNSTRLLVADVAADRAIDATCIASRRSRASARGSTPAGASATPRCSASSRCSSATARRSTSTARPPRPPSSRAPCATPANGAEFTAQINERYGLDARTISGDEEAALTFAGATSERPHDGDRSLVCRHRRRLDGVRRRPRRRRRVPRLHAGRRRAPVRAPPARRPAAARAASTSLAAGGPGDHHRRRPADVRDRVQLGIAVAGTATQCAAIELALEPYDPARVHGHVLELGDVRDAARAPRPDDGRRSGARSSACTPIARRRSSPAS